MNEYKITKGPKGRSLYFKNGKLISVKDIPEDILASLQPTQEAPDRKCIFCGQPGTEEKWLNGQTHYLCSEDYQNRTTGEVAEKIRLGLAIAS